MKKNIIILLVTLAAVLTITGCGKDEKVEGEHYIVATTTILGDATKVIAGDHVEVTVLMGPGIDPHLYKASAGDMKAMEKADMVIHNGLHLEGKMGDIFDNFDQIGKKVVNASKGISQENLLQSEDAELAFDPHIWFDVSLWQEAVVEINKGLKDLAPEHAEEFDKNLEKYLAELDELDQYIKDQGAQIPEDKRVLVTAHDAFSYFGQAYGFEVRGIQGMSTTAEAGTKEVRDLTDFIVAQEIRSIFIESSIPTKNIEALQEAVRAKGFDVQIGGELYSDSLGDAASGHDTYITTFKANIDTIVNGLK